VRDAKAAKSFRAAGDRIVRQERATPSVVSRLLTAPRPSAREAVTDEDTWSVRLGALATLGQYDGLTVVMPGTAGPKRAHNVPDARPDPTLAAAIDDAARTNTLAHLRSTVELSDGRLASAALVAPLPAGERGTGTLVALRVGRQFGAVDALTAAAVAEIVTLELIREIGARRDAASRGEALTLYELARAGLFAPTIPEALHNIAALIAGNFRNDLVQLWTVRSDGALRLLASHPEDGLPVEITRPSDHEPLGSVLAHDVTTRITRATHRSWIPDHITDLIVSPLSTETAPIGVLVLGRAREPFVSEDEDLAKAMGSFVGRLIRSRTPVDPDEVPDETEADTTAAIEWAAEPQMSPS
jgi:GTP-sensing pleiotropic transcriptional regulator CodY